MRLRLRVRRLGAVSGDSETLTEDHADNFATSDVLGEIKTHVSEKITEMETYLANGREMLRAMRRIRDAL